MPSLNWIGRDAVERHHTTVPFHLVKADAKRSVGNPDSGNLLLEGDNLLALKALLPYYAGQVKCIYIDPPYNTGNEGWAYNDNVSSPLMRQWLEDTFQGRKIDKDDLSKHDKWLCMMYPRLVLLRQFLKEDGVIFISIDDFEAAHLKCLMDEIFGGRNFIAQLVWEKGRKNDAKLFSVGHEYMMVFARSLEYLRRKKVIWREPKPGAKEIWDEYCSLREKFGRDDAAIEEALKAWYKALPPKNPSKALSRYKHIDQYGPWRDRDISWPGGGGPRYDVIHPFTKQPCKVPDRGWGFATTEEMQRQIDLGLVVFREDHTKPPFRKAHLRPIPEELSEEESDVEEENGEKDNEEVGLQVMPSVIYKQSQVAVKHLRKMMGGKVFENPKDHEVIARILRYVTEPGEIILDSFAGSGTTGHAVLRVNHDSAEDLPRRFILVEMEAKIAQAITTERLRRAIHGYSDIEGLDGSFQYCTLGETLFNGEGHIRAEVTFSDLARFVYLRATGTALPKGKNGKTPLLGIHNGTAVYLLYNGVLKDKSSGGGNALTRQVLATLPAHNGSKIIFGMRCLLGDERLRREKITFKHIPTDLQVD